MVLKSWLSAPLDGWCPGRGTQTCPGWQADSTCGLVQRLTRSVFGFLNLFDLLSVIEFFLVLFERLRQDGVPSCVRCSVEVLLQCVVHALTVVDQVVLLLLQEGRTWLFLHLFLSQDDFVILLLAHLSLKVLLLDPDTTIILFFLGGQALVECGLAVSHVFSPLLDAPPALLEGLVSLVQLVLVVLLASLDSLQFFLFSVHVELGHRLLLF